MPKNETNRLFVAGRLIGAGRAGRRRRRRVRAAGGGGPAAAATAGAVAAVHGVGAVAGGHGGGGRLFDAQNLRVLLLEPRQDVVVGERLLNKTNALFLKK